MAQVLSLEATRKERQFRRDLAAALRPKRVAKSTRRALAAQQVRIAAQAAL